MNFNSNYKLIGSKIQEQASSREGIRDFLGSLGVDVTKDDYFMVRESKLPYARSINQYLHCTVWRGYDEWI